MTIHPIRLNGNWLEGYAIDYHTEHSEYLGDNEFGHPIFDTKRSEIGELLYKLKYMHKDELVSDITKILQPFLLKWDLKNKVDIILPAPPSNMNREFQPVFLIAKSIADTINKKSFNHILEKKNSSQIKNLTNEEKNKELSGFIEKTHIFNKKCNILVVDDLYKSGATLNEICKILKKDKNVNNIYVLTMTKTRR